MNEEQSKSVFDWVTDNSMYVNKNECNNFQPPFLTYIPVGVPDKNINIDSELKGILRNVSKCNNCKYAPISYNEDLKKTDVYPNNKKECTK